MRHIRPLLLVVMLAVAAPGAAMAKERPAHSEFALGTACAALNLLYGPTKVAFAVLGTVTGSAAWLLTGGNGEVARTIIQNSVRGDYVIKPENLTFEEPLEFYGRDPKASYW